MPRPPTMALAIAWIALAGFPLQAQRGDVSGEHQPPSSIEAPAAPVLSPDAALQAFVVPEGLRVELVASEPLVEDPVDMRFDEHGRLWVIEMRGFMPDVDGKDETEPVGRIVVLEDVDGDGRMDKSTPFVEDLVLPRALTLVRGGALFIEPPYLRWYTDRDGDLQPDEDAIVATGFSGITNVEHAGNGLLQNIDNWIYLANHPQRLRFMSGQWVFEESFGGGQWGLAKDDVGRLYYNYNSDYLRADLIPPHLPLRNPHLASPAGVNVRLDKNQEVWPARVTTGVNRGYRPGTLRADGRLRSFTAACAPLVYRGDALPREYQGNAFVCEPSGNLVRRSVLSEGRGKLAAHNAYEKREFLTSTDERFRPVNLSDGPDGALYIVDFYRGIIQHRVFVTSYLRREILSRKLQEPTGLGRIWRVVPKSRTPAPRGHAGPIEDATLVELLAHRNGWWRDTAQRLLIERDASETAPALRALLAEHADPRVRLHALWTLEGLRALLASDAQKGLLDDDAHVVTAALQARVAAASRWPTEDRARVEEIVQSLVDHPDVLVRRYLALTARNHPTRVSILLRDASDATTRDAVLSGIAGEEIRLLELLWGHAAWLSRSAGRPAFLTRAADCVVSARRPDHISRLLDLVTSPKTPGWAALALLRGISSNVPKDPQQRARWRLPLTQAPRALTPLEERAPEELRKALEALDPHWSWPGREGKTVVPPVTPLTKEEDLRWHRGRDLYGRTCGACHQRHGKGWQGLAPPLRDSEWVWGNPERLVKIVLQGVEGPIAVNGTTWRLAMPGHAQLSDEDIAAVLTYIRREWGHEADPVTPKEVQGIRGGTKGRDAPWTAPELELIK